MKKHKHLCGVLAVVLLGFLNSCASMIYDPIGLKIYQEKPKNLSAPGYCDYKIEKYKFPDGKVADVYMFKSLKDQGT